MDKSRIAVQLEICNYGFGVKYKPSIQGGKMSSAVLNWHIDINQPVQIR